MRTQRSLDRVTKPGARPYHLRLPMQLRERIIADTTWRYTDDESPRRALLCLPGAMGAIESGRHSLELFAAQRRIIQVTYPDVPTLQEFSNGVVTLLDGLGIDRVDVLGGSFGGYLAQCLARSHPHRVGDLVLVHAFVLDERGARNLARTNRLAAYFPAWVFQHLTALKLRAVLRPIRQFRPDAYGTIVRQALEGARSALTVPAIRRNNAWMTDGVRDTGRHTAVEAANRRVLIIESDNDPVIRAPARAALRSAHPAAVVKTFHGTGHVTTLAVPVEYAAVVTAFLSSRPAP